MIPNPWFILGIVLIWVASLAGVGYWQNEAGHVAERDTWQKREMKELATANDTIVKLNKEKADKEKAHADAVAAIDAKHQGELTAKRAETARLVAAARAGTVRLRDPASSQSACASGTSAPAASPGGGASAAGTELSKEASGFLLALTGEADEVVLQLGACQAIIIEDRK